jgi:ParB-like chromosome segregation protein Spo0J
LEQQWVIDVPRERLRTERSTGEAGAATELLQGDAPTEWLPVKALVPGDSPRLGGEDAEHIRVLARLDTKLPPIIVHRTTMKIIDGAHRLGAALLRGDKLIEARWFDGTEQEAFVLAVQANIAHGLPLSLADRTTAAERILASHPSWSDRAIAAATGLGARTVGSVRRRVEGGMGSAETTHSRIGRDGRRRPIDSAEGRIKASEIIKSLPDASLRDIARKAGVSPSTVRDVRNRLQRGEDAVPAPRIQAPHSSEGQASTTARPAPAAPAQQQRPKPKLGSMLQGLKSDPSLRFNEAGRTVLRWIFSRAIHPEEWQDIAGKVPPHTSYLMADVARRCAEEWLELADNLEQRARQTA